MSKIDKGAFKYSGQDNLEAMKLAHNYNGFLLELIEAYIPQGGSILEFGAGIGQFALPLHEKGLSVTAIELDASMAASLTSRGVPTHLDLAEVEDASVDFIYCMNVLEHISDDGLVIQMMRRKLRPGGVLLVYVPAFPLLYSSMDKLVGHYRRYRKNSLMALARTHELQPVRCEYVDSLGFLASLVYKALPSQDGTVTPGSISMYDSLVFPASRLLDRAFKSFFGKNLLLVSTATRP